MEPPAEDVMVMVAVAGAVEFRVRMVQLPSAATVAVPITDRARFVLRAVIVLPAVMVAVPVIRHSRRSERNCADAVSWSAGVTVAKAPVPKVAGALLPAALVATSFSEYAVPLVSPFSTAVRAAASVVTVTGVPVAGVAVRM